MVEFVGAPQSECFRCSREEMGLARDYTLDASLKLSCWRLIAGISAFVWATARAMRWMLRVIARHLPACPASEPVMRSASPWSGSRLAPAREARRYMRGLSLGVRLGLLVSQLQPLLCALPAPCRILCCASTISAPQIYRPVLGLLPVLVRTYQSRC